MTARPAALVTGGATRVGRFFASHLAARGYAIALHYNRSRDEAERAAEAIRQAGGACECFACDFHGDDVEALIPRVVERFPGLALLVNSASAYAPGELRETSRETLEEQFSVNLFAPFLLGKRFSLAVEAGAIVNIVDNKIAFAQYPYAAYLLAKKSLDELTRMMALELAPAIRVNAIAPGVILPAQTRTDDYLAWRHAGIPLARQGAVEELGQALDYLLDNRFVTGQTLFVDGGESVNQVGRHSENYPGEKR
ncbi:MULTISPECIES: SDR family oxidoreductase [unclassified Modicisalibacter]|uniref:SDR family oxidoreductase n=1 Tax=unclassified Modicisalibacter TaxID=2679913 RepID=UPI001CCEEA9D|nr:MULTISPECIES: SDR family oxidoreductase [unclassified Modicisalibacter]MBZ9558884.1 SDR family oxidoreductase [Modicisalibacter sp. R2A 31.J]MBZ9575224.1 SDR family oxidoreductase [Modicisalibacter sp. MOD 31.J]